MQLSYGWPFDRTCGRAKHMALNLPAHPTHLSPGCFWVGFWPAQAAPDCRHEVFSCDRGPSSEDVFAFWKLLLGGSFTLPLLFCSWPHPNQPDLAFLVSLGRFWKTRQEANLLCMRNPFRTRFLMIPQNTNNDQYFNHGFISWYPQYATENR